MSPVQSYKLSALIGMSICNGIIASRHEAEGDKMDMCMGIGCSVADECTRHTREPDMKQHFSEYEGCYGGRLPKDNCTGFQQQSATVEGDKMSEEKEDFYDSVESSPQESVMEHVAALAEALREAEVDVSSAEQSLIDAKTRLQTAKDSVVQFYSSQNIHKLELATGEIVEVNEKLTCSQIKDETRLKKAYAWLRQHDGDYLIKRKLEVEELDDEFVADLTAAGYKEGADFAVKEAVNTASLKSFLSEKLGRKAAVATVAIEDVPAEFGLYIFNEVTIKGAK